METPITGVRPMLIKAWDRSLEKGEARVGPLRIPTNQPTTGECQRIQTDWSWCVSMVCILIYNTI